VIETRLVPLAGPANFRDLGGYENRHARMVRTGVLYRSDSLSTLTDDDVRHCVDRLRLRTVVDLRAGHEVDRFRHGPLEAEGVSFLHMPIVDETRRPPDAETEAPGVDAMTLERIYLMMLDRFADRFAAVLGVIADAGSHPLVFHCAAGKDRTGLVAALVLGLLDVHDDVIAADYALTAHVMPTLIERHRARATTGHEPEVGRQMWAAEAPAMRAVLQDLRDRHGSIEGYVRAAGLGSAEIAALRAALLD
jgi:protein-tyrosine phosphatase